MSLCSGTPFRRNGSTISSLIAETRAALRNGVQATLDGHAVDIVCSVQTPAVFRPLSPRRVIRERGKHLHIVPVTFQKLTQSDVVRRNSGDLRCVVDPPNDHPHWSTH